MIKDLKAYVEKYGDIPEDFKERFNLLYRDMNEKQRAVVLESILQLEKMKQESLRFIFYIEPKATPRARYTGRTSIFYVKNASFNNELFKEFIENKDYPIIKTPCSVEMNIYLPITGMNKVDTLLAEMGYIPPVSKPDTDNVAKTYLDMIQKHLLLDDSLVSSLIVNKLYSIKPRVDITITYLESYGSNYNKKKIENWKSFKERY